LELDVQLETPAQVAIGEYAKFQIVIVNRGNATARGVIIKDTFSPGLRHPGRPGETAIESDQPFDLAPNESKTRPLTFEVLAEGQQCHTVPVTASDADTVSKQGCVTGLKPSFASFQIDGPVTRTQGETAQFNIVIKNGALAARNVAVVLKFDAALELIPTADSRYQQLPDGTILLNIGDLAANEQRTFREQPIEARCTRDSTNACVQADLTVGGAFAYSDQHCLEIRPADPGVLAP
jgi:uncharacterized repeat protein (TIGR01451 family)